MGRISFPKKWLPIGVACISIAVVLAFFGNQKTGISAVKSLWIELSPDQAKQQEIIIPSFAPLVDKAAPAVLVVTTEVVMEQQQLPGGAEPFDLFPFFGPQRRGPQKSVGQGSGFIIHPSGYALTNHHVVEGATKITVKIGTELKTYPAELVGSDQTTDVALIKIKSDRTDWPVIPLGNSDKLRVGDWAVAIGNPLGLEISVSKGILSARGRRDVHPSGKRGLYDFMQIDAPINPGNSGGPLLNMTGEAVGINTAISAQGQGIAFAIPMNQVKQILPQLKEKGHATRSWLGVQIGDVSEGLAKEMGLTESYGALVREVKAKSPAAKVGIEAGDIITEFDGSKVKDASSLQAMAGLAGAGKSVPLTYVRDGVAKTVRITLEALPDDGASKKLKKLPAGKSADMGELGISVETSAGKVKGVRVAEVDPRSIAAYAGIEAGDIIVKINGKDTNDAGSFTNIVKAVPKNGLVRVLLRRGAATLFISFQKP